MQNIVLYFILIAVITASNSSAAGSNIKSSDSGASPVTFLQNQGQWQSEILYQGISTATNVYLLNDGLSFSQPGKSIKKSDGTKEYPYLVWNMKFINPDSALKVYGINGKESVVSYLNSSDSTQWIIHPTEYQSINYENIFEKVDLYIYGDNHDLKYDFIVKAGGHINSILAFYEGIEQLTINASGELEVKNIWNTQVQRKPVAWQVINGSKVYIDVEYLILNDTTFGFTAINGYDTNYDLVIDPLFQMVWSSYTKATGAGNNTNYCFSNAMDAYGNVYLTGMVDGTYPVTPGVYSGPGSIVPEIFVSKFSADGSTLLYSTYIPGSSYEHGVGITVDILGRAYITGYAMANWTGGNTYPTTSSAYQPSMYPSGGNDAIFTVLNPIGTGLVYSTFLGGSNDDIGYDIKLGSDGTAYITGTTQSTNFPIKASGIIQTGNHDVFVAKFDITKSGTNSLIYSVKIGGNGQSKGRSIAVNNAGNAFITGSFLKSGTLEYPRTSGAYNSIYNGGNDNSMVIVTKLSATTPVTINYSTYIGPGVGNAITVQPNLNEAYITGHTRTFSFPVTSGVLQPIHGQDALGNPNNDAFVVKLNSVGSALTYSTFLGGKTEDTGSGIVVNSAGEVYVAGIGTTDFPTSVGAYQQNNAGSKDFFVVHLNPNASEYACGGSTFVGGTDTDYSSSLYDYPAPIISLRDNGGNYDTLSITATSHSQDFPTTSGSYSPVKLNGIADQPVFFKLTCFNSPLPIELLSFEAEPIEGNAVVCKWITASELNNHYFTIQKSVDAELFEDVAHIPGAGNSSSQLNYSYIDYNPFSGISFYRLKQTDFDGTNSNSQIVAIDLKTEEGSVLTYPNPSFDKVILKNTKEGQKVTILNIKGQEVKCFRNLMVLDISDITAGFYFLIISDEEGNISHSQKLIIY